VRHINLRLKVYGTDGKGSQEFKLPLPRYADAQEHANMHEIANFIRLLKAQFPGNEFQVVPAGRNRWNVFPQPLANA
jgi:hypothetical protein